MKRSHFTTFEVLTIIMFFVAVFMTGALVGYLFFEIAAFAH